MKVPNRHGYWFSVVNLGDALVKSWSAPLMKLGNKRPLNEEDIPSTMPEDDSAILTQAMLK